jgi:hypothetical protein
MIRSIIVFFFCLVGLNGYSQDETVMLTAEKSSDWIKVEMPVITRAARSSGTAKKKVTRPRSQSSDRQPTSPPAQKDDFDKTNNKIKRFKKG